MEHTFEDLERADESRYDKAGKSIQNKFSAKFLKGIKYTKTSLPEKNGRSKLHR